MPTGYTAYIEETENPTFEEFVMRCARAFGACVMLREESLSKPIPEFVVSDYYSKSVKEAKAALCKLERMTEDEIIKAAESDYDTKLKQHNEWAAEISGNNRKYAEMITKINEWMPPSEEHMGLKKFMIEQINMSIHNYDISEYAPAKVSPSMWYCGQVRDAEKTLKWRIESYDKEVERAIAANKWVKDLRASLV